VLQNTFDKNLNLKCSPVELNRKEQQPRGCDRMSQGNRIIFVSL